MRKIAFLGPAATFTNLAVRHAFPEEEHIPYVTIPACMDAVINGDMDFAVVPIENTLEGTVNLTIDYLFHEADLKIVAEVTEPIQQHLLVHKEYAYDWQKTGKVLSHPHAIAQCHKFLHSYFPDIPHEQAASTAAAAKYVKEHPEQRLAAIANELSAQEYDLAIAKVNIHDYDFNHTRFIVLARQETELSLPLDRPRDKTTVVITLPSDRPGALHQVLSAFSWRNINLSKIESRPLKTGLGNYFFILDIEQRMDEVLLPGAFAEMEALGCKVHVLGSYRAYSIQPDEREADK
ncbi:prephenate dehydratase [Bacillus badius]|uniref:Prephenate dehydratase n=1 Tax=Bacillus badius TaxID=1455 RepID=A0ABR5AT92_BACBA|nr:prephenate dehydratase [Bacillus badius]KIL75463.1 Prephenate dehydratase [Bacillus badius]KIL77975.1 Prephenate dehydratase [Bacillus badius]KZR58386.1 prephenate dehydratase [Bacillus badius]MED4716406.1 prephenate dehydratase [Bacillus badius]